jgi:hypothetical protein
VQFFLERTVPMDKTETCFVNISLLKADYSNKEQGYSDGEYQFLIEVTAASRATYNSRGDSLSAIRVQKVTGIIRYILEYSGYKTLGFTPPFILHTELDKFQMFKMEGNTDASNICQSQMVFKVLCGEVTMDEPSGTFNLNETTAKIELTEKGYLYV